MSKPIYNHENEERYPHAADALERQFAENGFSRGWAMHQKPVARRCFDCHVHYAGTGVLAFVDALRGYAQTAEAMESDRALLIMRVHGAKNDNTVPTSDATETEDIFPHWFSVDEAKTNMDCAPFEDRFFWAAWLDHREPDLQLIHASANAGARAIKLHNAPVIENNAPYDLWLSNEWQDAFNVIGQLELPVLFHVTQRLTSSIYTGGGRNTYWEKGWKNGVTYGNEELLQAFLECCRRRPEVAFIGAHQLHVGWERLDDLFAALPNLYVDTTVGCMLRLFDNFYPHDQEYLRKVFIRWADRIIFGTDSLWGLQSLSDYASNLTQHLRFIYALDLPEDVLELILHGNIERLCHINGHAATTYK